MSHPTLHRHDIVHFVHNDLTVLFPPCDTKPQGRNKAEVFVTKADNIMPTKSWGDYGIKADAFKTECWIGPTQRPFAF